MMQNLKTRVSISLDSERKLAFLKDRARGRIDRKHRHPQVERDQLMSRADALKQTGIAIRETSQL